MRGKILGVSDDKGVILADGDKRFTFAMSDWCEEQAPKRGQVVDFVDNDGAAVEIYAALGGIAGLSSGIDVSGESASAAAAKFMESAGENDVVRKIWERVRAFPQMALAAISIFAFFFMTYAGFGYDGTQLNRQVGMNKFGNTIHMESTLSEFNEEVGFVRDQSDAIITQLKLRIANKKAATSSYRSTRNAERIVEWERIVKVIEKESWLLLGARLFWLIPITAIGVIGLHWFGRHGLARSSGMLMGVASVAAGLFIPIWQNNTISAVPRNIRASVSPLIEDAFTLEWGGWMIVLCGLGCLVLALRRARTA